MYKNLSITDFFKSFSQPQRNKRSSDGNLKNSEVAKPSPSGTPHDAVEISTQHEAKEDHIGTADHGNSSGPKKRSPVRDGVVGAISHGSDTKELLQPDSPSDKIDAQPVGPQGPTHIGSQRMIINGEIIIRNSDDESDSEGSLEDIDKLLEARKPTAASLAVSHPLGLSSPGPTGPNRSITRSKTKGATSDRTLQSSSNLPARPAYKFSLDSLKRQNEQNEAIEAGTMQAWSLLDSVEENVSSQKSIQISAAGVQKIDAELMTSVLKGKGESEDIGRLMTAIQRTEALDLSRTWSFFEATNGQRFGADWRFPKTLKMRWHKILSDPSTRDQAFLGGFVGDMASKEELPGELLIWLFDQACVESRDDLRHSYAQTIEEAQTLMEEPLVTPLVMKQFFQRLGASTRALDINKPILPRLGYSQNSDVLDWSTLVWMLSLIGRLSNNLNMETRKHTLCILCRLLLDTSIVQSYESLDAIEFAFVNVLSSIPNKSFEDEIQDVLATVYLFVPDSTFRLQLLQNLPTCSPRAVGFRRRLALAYFFHDKDCLAESTSDMLDLRTISEELQASRFTIRSDTDYSELAAVVGMLSIAIDRGDPPPAHSDEQQRACFNEGIDLIASRIGEIFTSIVDTGASHMKRTAAKEMLEAFHSKLLYAVRTKRKPKTMMFGGSDTLTLMQKGAFRSFFDRKTDMQTQDL